MKRGDRVLGVLQRDALLVTGADGTFILATGSVCVEGPPWSSPLRLKDEPSVWAYVPSKQRWYHGWLAANTSLQRVAPKRRVKALRPLDALRSAAVHTPPRYGRNKFDEPIGAYSPRQWLLLNAFTIENAWLDRVARDAHIPIGPSKGAAAKDRLARIRRLIVGICTDAKELTMKQAAAEHETLKAEVAAKQEKVAKKKVAKKVRAEKKAAKGPKGGKTITRVAESLTSLKAPKLAALAVPGAGKAQLQKLRDGINALADTAREKKQGKRASELSSLNRLVRRLARSA